MTLEEKENTPPDADCEGFQINMPQDGDNGGFQLIDFNIPQREKAMVHPAVDPPLCASCQKMDLTFFDPNCPNCQEILMNANTTVPEIFAILRQWTPQTQQSLELLVREILKRGAHVNDRDGLTDMTMLHYACKAGANGVGDVEEACRMVNLLIAKDADVYIRCRWTNMTALHYATYFDIAPVIKVLLKATKAMDVDSPCAEFDHGTPLHVAAANLALESAKVLLQNGADLEARDDLGRTPLECVSDPAAFDPNSEMSQMASRMRKMLQEAEPMSPPHPLANYDNIQSKVTLQSLGLRLGDKVVVGGVKTGVLRYCGPTEFAPGVWAGIELDESAGKNDGTVGGISYFKCSPKHGIFAPVSKISKPGSSLTPRNSMLSKSRSSGMDHGKVDTSHVTARVDTGLSRRSGKHGDVDVLDCGERVLVAGQRRGVIRFSGETDFAPGWWYGIELDRPVGKNDGCVNNRRYFTCKPKYGVFAPPSRVQKINDMHGSRESLDSFASPLSDRHRPLSGGNGTGSHPSLHTTPARSKSSSTRSKMTLNKSKSVEKPPIKRPKSSGSAGMMRRSVSQPAVPVGTGGGEFKLQEGMSVFCNNELGVLRYIGTVEFAAGIWLGVELRIPKGKNDGSVQGKRYFTCRPNHGLIVRPSKVTVRGINGAKLLGEAYSNEAKS